VGNSSGELADSLEFLRFEELFGEHSFFGNVFRHGLKIFTMACLGPRQTRVQANADDAAVFFFPFHFHIRASRARLPYKALAILRIAKHIRPVDLLQVFHRIVGEHRDQRGIGVDQVAGLVHLVDAERSVLHQTSIALFALP
jgi:hypothetical protein